jgi:hypothetical protein
MICPKYRGRAREKRVAMRVRISETNSKPTPAGPRRTLKTVLAVGVGMKAVIMQYKSGLVKKCDRKENIFALQMRLDLVQEPHAF